MILQVKSLTKKFGGLVAVNQVSFQVNKGEIFGLIGPNGSGKTTLFNLITNVYKPTSGTIYFNNNNITGLKTHKICKLGIGRTFQVMKPLARLTVFENIMTSAFLHSQNKRQAMDIAKDVMQFCHLENRKDLLAKSLPIGERKRLEIARALATQPKLLLLDETSAGLNPFELNDAIALIQKIREQGITIIIVEHIMKVIMSISDRIHAINFGQTIAEGTPEEVSNNPMVIEAYLGEKYVHSQ